LARTRSIACQSGPPSRIGTVSSGRAARVRVSPAAMPTRRSPKSKARMMRGRRASGMPGLGAHLVHVDAQQAPGGKPAFLIREIEEHGLVHGQGKPGVVEELALQLARLPAGIAQG